MRRLLRILFAVAGIACVGAAAEPAAAVVFLYHHFGDARYPSANIRLEQFDAHLDTIEKRGYRVLPFSEIVRCLAEGKPLPEKTVAITMDDAYASIYAHAYPRLKKRGWPFTVFVNSDPVDRGYSNFMSWDQMRDMQRHGAEFANHSATHLSAVRRAEESDTAWRSRMIAEISDAQKRLQEELGAHCNEAPRLFAYPFGEYTPEAAALVRELGYIGISQTSGPVGSGADLGALPRFPMNEAQGALSGFILKLRTLPLPIVSAEPGSPVVRGKEAPRMVLKLQRPLSGLQCYRSDGERLGITQRSATAFEIRSDRPIRLPRDRYTCTAPAGEGRWYWYSHLWIAGKKE